MKGKLLLILGCITLGSYTALAQSFTSGNLAVYRYGDGSTALPNGQTVPVFIDEYTPAGVLVKTRAIPAVNNGVNFKLTGLGKTVTGIYSTEGMSTLSEDGKYLTIFGYNQIAGAAIPTTANGLVVGVISADGSYNSTTTLSNDAASGLGAPRSAIFDGTTDIWAAGSQNGIQYTTLGATTSTRISAAQDASKSLMIGKASASGVFGANRLYAATATASTELPYATPLPKTSTTFSTSTPFNASITANQVFVLSVENRTIIYVADDAANTIRRYYLNFSGAAIGPFAALSDDNTTKIKSITAKVRGREGTKTVVDVYATTWGDEGDGTGTSKLLTFTDRYLTTNPTDIPNVELATATTSIATAPANTLFKSVTFVPAGSNAVGSVVLPIKLGIFEGRKINSGIQLNWTTLSEKNNSYFNILRSGNGEGFESIAKVMSKGNSDDLKEYSFLDAQPLSGTNYYQLSQVDFDEKSTLTKVISVDYGLSGTELSVEANTGNKMMSISIYSPNIDKGKILVYNIAGQESGSLNVSLIKGNNTFVIPFNSLSGIYMVSFSSQKGKITKKVLVK